MAEDSVLLIDEKVIPDEKVLDKNDMKYTSEISLMMYALFKSLERKEGHWRRLLEDAGLEVKEIRKYTEIHDSVIVAVRK